MRIAVPCDRALSNLRFTLRIRHQVAILGGVCKCRWFVAIVIKQPSVPRAPCYDSGDRTIEVVAPDVMTRDGHCAYLPGSQWIINDTYPDRDRFQTVYLYHVPSGRKVEVGRFFLPPEYRGEWRCDTHPRFSRDGRFLVIDAPHADVGRQLHLIDIRKIVG